jgi:putative addiction module component (TIGR02574 family)
MSRSLTDLADEAMALPTESRAYLAEKLLETLDFEEDFQVSDAWKSEVRKRCRELDSGVVKSIPAEIVFREIREALA